MKSNIIFLSLFFSVSAFAFGGGSGGSSSAHSSGVDSFGAYFGGEGQVQISFSCTGELTPGQAGVCTCADENAKYLPAEKKCICKAGWQQKGTKCEFACPNKIENCTEYNPDCTCAACAEGYKTENGICTVNCPFIPNCTAQNPTTCACETCDIPYINKGTSCNCPTYAICTPGKAFQCPAGYTLNKAKDACTNCGVGKYKDNVGRNTCTLCPVNTYQDKKGQASCKPCPNGTYQDKTGQTSCKTCDTNNPCPGNQYCDNGTCKACGPTQIPTEDKTGCECPDATYPDGNGECTTCPKGKFQDDSGTCFPCANTTSHNYTSEENCNACNYEGSTHPRKVLKMHGINYCALEKCPKGYFQTAYGNCVSCSDETAYYNIPEQNCTSCNTNESIYWRALDANNKCALCQIDDQCGCPENATYQGNGICG